jgi:hypothetical protein
MSVREFRKENENSGRSSTLSVHTLKNNICSSGHADLFGVLSEACTKSGIQHFLEEMQSLDGYDLRVVCDTEIDDILSKAVARRLGSANRFKLMLQMVRERNQRFTLAAVSHCQNETGADLAFISEHGWLACTCGEFARRGGPCRHLWKCYAMGYFTFNPVLHLHPLWLEDPNICRSTEVDKLSVQSPRAVLDHIIKSR